MTKNEIVQLAKEIIEDREIRDTGDAKWYSEELDADWDTQSAVYDEIIKQLGL